MEFLFSFGTAKLHSVLPSVRSFSVLSERWPGARSLELDAGHTCSSPCRHIAILQF